MRRETSTKTIKEQIKRVGNEFIEKRGGGQLEKGLKNIKQDRCHNEEMRKRKL